MSFSSGVLIGRIFFFAANFFQNIRNENESEDRLLAASLSAAQDEKAKLSAELSAEKTKIKDKANQVVALEKANKELNVLLDKEKKV